MNMSVEATTCDWCLRGAPVRIIEEQLWRFWKIISAEDPVVASRRNICEECRSRCEAFFAYIQKCKSNETAVVRTLIPGRVKAEPLMDIEYHSLIKEEGRNEETLHPNRPTVSDRTKEEPSIDAIDEEISYPGYATCDNEDGISSALPVAVKPEELPGSAVSTSVACTYCDKTFKYPSALTAHSRVHTGERPFGCPVCDKAFTQPSYLKTHMYLHTGERPFECSVCHKTFTKSNHLTSHVRLHTGEKPFKCSFCDKAFSQSSGLNRHMRLHTGEQPFRCFACDKTFNECSTLKNHMRLHTGEKPFKCPHCDKAFTQSSRLKPHMRIHTNEKPFSCYVCGKSFNMSSTLTRHMRLHT